MTDETPSKRSLSEISHLFLSSVREKQTNGAPRPQRIPPGQARLPVSVELTDDGAIDLTKEEMADAFGTAGASAHGRMAALAPVRRTPPVTAVLGAHLSGRQSDRVKEYARHLSAIHGRIGLIEIEANEFRLTSFESGDAVMDSDLDETESAESCDSREMADALEEMNWDVDRWLVLVLNPRTPEARTVLREIGHWTLLSTCDHDGVVSSYRTLKGLAESYRPSLSLALLDGIDPSEIQRVHCKLSGVCQQFLNWELDDEPAVQKSTQTIEHLVLRYRPARDKGQIAAAPHWETVSHFLQSIKAAAGGPVPAPSQNQEELDPMEDTYQQASVTSSVVAEMPAPAPTGPRMRPANGFTTVTQTPAPIPMPRLATGPTPVRDTSVDVIDLPMDAGPEAILTAILQQNHGALIECPVRAPMCEGARLAITRDRRIVLLAVTREGLSDLRNIGQAYRWVSENRALIGMAIPQFAIDATQVPLLRLLVDHADIAADVLHPILHADHVTVQAYRKLRWGGRTGLFLEAA